MKEYREHRREKIMKEIQTFLRTEEQPTFSKDPPNAL